jgi:hypothetical protein
MKRKLSIAVLVVAVLLMSAGLGTLLFMNSIIKKGVETAGPKIAKVEMKLDSASISLLSGRGTLRGLVVGNPAGYKAPYAIKVRQASVALKPSSVFADKVVVQSVNLLAPEITFEGSLKGNNLGRILENIRQFTATERSARAKLKQGAGKRIQIDDLAVTGGRINLSVTWLGGKALSVPLPDIHLTELGKGADGVSAGELVEKLFGSVFDNTVKAVTEPLGRLGKEATAAAKTLGETTAEGAGQASKSIGDLLKRK